MSLPSESVIMSNELQNSDLIYVNLVTDVLKLLPNIAIYRLVGTDFELGVVKSFIQNI